MKQRHFEVIHAVNPCTRVVRACTLTLVLTAAAFASAQGTMAPDKMQAAPGSSGSMAMKQSMSGMMKDMHDMPMTGDSDHDFAAMMKAHHQGAIDMAQAELASGKDPTLRKMAQDIITAQKKEIKAFDDWMRKHPANGAPADHK
jgi:uncharacterized protein (DUF305 family)